jgi:hypothetical protein
MARASTARHTRDRKGARIGGRSRLRNRRLASVSWDFCRWAMAYNARREIEAALELSVRALYSQGADHLPRALLVEHVNAIREGCRVHASDPVVANGWFCGQSSAAIAIPQHHWVHRDVERRGYHSVMGYRLHELPPDAHPTRCWLGFAKESGYVEAHALLVCGWAKRKGRVIDASAFRRRRGSVTTRERAAVEQLLNEVREQNARTREDLARFREFAEFHDLSIEISEESPDAAEGLAFIDKDLARANKARASADPKVKPVVSKWINALKVRRTLVARLLAISEALETATTKLKTDK